jgi:hypothetical protein
MTNILVLLVALTLMVWFNNSVATDAVATLYDRLQLVKTHVEICKTIKSSYIGSAAGSSSSSSSSTALFVKQLNTCGYVIRTDLPIDSPENLLEREMKTKIMKEVPIAKVNRQAFNRGETHLSTKDSSMLKEKYENLLAHTVPNNGTLTSVFAEIFSGPSQSKTDWKRFEFVYEQSVLARHGLSPADTEFPVRLDVILPLRSQASETEVCFGGHLLININQNDCASIVADQQLFKYCEMFAKNDCPKDLIIRPTLNLGEALVLHSNSLRRTIGYTSNLGQGRVDIHAVFRFGWWWNSSICSSTEQESKSCGAAANESEEEVATSLSCRAESVKENKKSSEVALWFGNHDIAGNDVAVYFGNDQRLFTLLPTSSNSYSAIPGTYTLRVDGVSRKVWKVTASNVSQIFYACRENLDFPVI